MENRYPDPICDGNPTRRDLFFACLFWIGGAVGGCAAIYYAGVGLARVFWGL